jgi:hypothetical protein
MKKYVMAFTGVNLVLTAVLALLVGALKIKGGTSTSMGASLAMASAFVAGWLFFRDHDRAPSVKEKISFAWKSLATIWALSLTVAAVVLPFYMSARDFQSVLSLITSSRYVGYFAGVFLFVSAIYYFGIRWSFGWYAKFAAKQR